MAAPPESDLELELAKAKPRQKRTKTTTSQGDRRREQLISTAEKMLAEQHIENLTYADISQAAGIPLSSCYHFFKNKLDLIQEVSETLGARYQTEVANIQIEAEAVPSWMDAVNLVFENGEKFFKRYPAAYEVWLSPHVPAAVSTRSLSRTRSNSNPIKNYISQHFELPDIDHIDDVFFIAIEIADAVAAVARQTETERPFFLREIRRAVNAYLSRYLPEVLPRRRAEGPNST